MDFGEDLSVEVGERLLPMGLARVMTRMNGAPGMVGARARRWCVLGCVGELSMSIECVSKWVGVYCGTVQWGADT